MATFSLKAFLGLDGKNFKAGVKGAQNDVKSFGKSLDGIKSMLIGAFSVTAIASFGKSIVELGSQISDIAVQTGMSVSSWETISRISGDAGVKVETMKNAMLKLRTAQDDAVANGGKMEQAFSALGITMEQVASLRTDELFERLSKAVVESNRGASEMQAITDIMGQRSAPQLLEVFQRIGAEGIEPMKKGLQEANLIMGDMTAAKLDEFGDKMERIKQQAKLVGAGIGMWGINALTFIDKFKQKYETDIIGLANPFKDNWEKIENISNLYTSLKGQSILGEMRDEEAKEREKVEADLKAQKDAETQAMKDALATRIAAEDAAEREKTAKIIAEHKKRVDDETKRMDAARQAAAKKNEQAAIANAKKAQAAEISVKRKGISAMEEGLRGVESRTGVDQLRNIGANVLGSGTNPWNDTAAQMKKQISIAERQLVQLEKIAGKNNSEGVF